MHERLGREKLSGLKEGKESPELFRGTLGLDFVFSVDSEQRLRCYCLEINGHDSGIKGVRDVPKDQIDPQHRIVASIRDTVDPEMHRKFSVANQVYDDVNAGNFTPSAEGLGKIKQYVAKSLRTSPSFLYANKNPDFIEDITRDKWLQEKYIPDEYRPRVWHEREPTGPANKLWVVKGRGSRGGDRVSIIDGDLFSRMLKSDNALDFIADHVIQEFIPSAGAEMMERSIGTRAASMRLLVDFRYLTDGTIKSDFVAAYQRVSPYETGTRIGEDGKRLTYDDLFVVNRARGAESVAASKEELAMAKRATEEIIHRMAADYSRHLQRSNA